VFGQIRVEIRPHVLFKLAFGAGERSAWCLSWYTCHWIEGCSLNH
jgi:hypothetical protein